MNDSNVRYSIFVIRYQWNSSFCKKNELSLLRACEIPKAISNSMQPAQCSPWQPVSFGQYVQEWPKCQTVNIAPSVLNCGLGWRYKSEGLGIDPQW